MLRLQFILSAILLGVVLGGLFSDGERLHAQASATSPSEPLRLPDVVINVDEIVATGFDQPTQVTSAGDGSNRLFVLEKTGKIWIIRDGAILPTPFLDISSVVTTTSDGGLLGLAFHPDFTANGYFYIYYARAGDGMSVIARYHVSDDPDVADPASAFTLLTVPLPLLLPMHRGGQLAFGPEGYLYIGLGDGGGGLSSDPNNNGQNINTLLGDMLRIDVDGGSPYAIPPDNPYVSANGLDEIWLSGLRNPWRFSFDRLTGDLYIGDVGALDWEEIDFLAVGATGGLNYGWKCREGAHPTTFAPPECNDGRIFTDPIVEYAHGDAASVTGGFVHRGALTPELNGRYFYGDFETGKIWSFYKTGPDTFSTPELELDTDLYISSFGEDDAGELYVVDFFAGGIRRLTGEAIALDLSPSTKNASTSHADPGEVVTYTIQLQNIGDPLTDTVFLTDTLPAGLSYVNGTLTATAGVVSSAGPNLYWQGALSSTMSVTITYQVNVIASSGALTNTAALDSAGLVVPVILTSTLIVPRPIATATATPTATGTLPPTATPTPTGIAPPGYRLWLPLVRK